MLQEMIKLHGEDTNHGANFSPCRTWRYLLWRGWDTTKPIINFLMLNPSIANEYRLDPTVTRCGNYAATWGYGGVIVTNLFALVSTDPVMLETHADPIGPDNDMAILMAAQMSESVVCAWGNIGKFGNRADNVRRMLSANGVETRCLRVNGTGEPAHPLYLPADLKPMPYIGTAAMPNTCVTNLKRADTHFTRP